MFANKKPRIFIYKLLTFIITPIVFAFLLLVIVLILINFKANGIVKYINVFFLKQPPSFGNIVNDIFVASTNNSQKVNIANIEFPKYASTFGKIEIKSQDMSCPLLYGDDVSSLDRGAGMYIGSSIPGYGGICLVAGHNTSFFKKLRYVAVGDIISVTTTYGVYEYKVYNIDVFPDNDKTAYDLKTQEQILALYTCYFVNTPVGNVKERLFVYSKLVSGPIIEK